MIRPLNWRQSAGVTLLLLLLATAEIWALNTPMLRDMQVDLLAQDSARDLSILLDLLLIVPLAILILTLIWREPAWLYARLTPLLRHSRRFVRSVAWMVLLPLGYAGTL